MIAVAQLMVVLDATIVNIALPSAERSLDFSTTDRQWVVTAYALAFGGLLVVGGRLSDLFGRKTTFVAGLAGFAAASAAGGAAPGFAALVTARATLDVPGSLLAAGGLVGIVYGFSQAGADGWGATATVAPIAAGVALLGAFAVVEQRVTRPLVPLSIIASRIRGTAYLGALIAGIGLSGTFLLVTFYLQDVLGFTPLPAGLAFLPFVAGAAGLLTGIGPHGGYGPWVAPGLVLLGLALGCIITPAFSLGPAGARPADTGVAAALVNSSNQVGFSLGAALLNTIAASAAASYLTRDAVVTALLFPRRAAQAAASDGDGD